VTDYMLALGCGGKALRFGFGLSEALPAFNRILKNVRELQEREGHALLRVSAWLTGLRETAFVRRAIAVGPSVQVKLYRSNRGPSAWGQIVSQGP